MVRTRNCCRVSKKTKVLHILWSGRSGGAERFVRDATVYSDKSKFEHGVCFLSKGGIIADQMANSGIKTYFVGMNSGFSVASSTQFLKIMNKVKPDIIHNHCRNYLINIFVLCFTKIGKIYFEHGGNLIGNKPKREIIFYNYFARFYDSILANSDYVRQRIIKLDRVNPRKVKTLYISIDSKKYEKNRVKEKLKRELDIQVDNKIIGTVGRLVAEKGIDDFIRVASEVLKLCNNCSFIVVGDGYKRSELEIFASSCNVEVNFLGDRSDISELLNLFDVFLFTSKWEAFGIAVLEAMASKVPVVGFAVGGTKEIFEKGGGGVLVEERDCRKLAEVVVDLLSDQEKYSKFSNEGRQNAMVNFDVRKNIKYLEKEYDSIIADRRGDEDPSC